MSLLSLPVATLGVPRIGPRRELKTALESYWSGATDADALLEVAAALRAANWARQKALGATILPSNDFSLYDHVLDTCAMVGAIPPIYGPVDGRVPLDLYFAMARGRSAATTGEICGCGHSHPATGLPALKMTKWFDTNYHYMVPEFTAGQRFALSSTKPIDDYREAKAIGYHTRPVLVGPVTFLKLGKSGDPTVSPLSLLSELLPVYVDVLRLLAAEGADWVEIDEPILVTDLDPESRDAFVEAYRVLSLAAPKIRIMLATWFGGLGDNLALATTLPVAGLHVDLVRAPEQLAAVVAALPADRVLSLGVIDGRNVWRADLEALLDRLEPVVAARGPDRLQLAPSCPLLHVPLDLALEVDLDPDLKDWLAFAAQKIDELAILARALVQGRDRVAAELAASSDAIGRRRLSGKVHDPVVAARLATVSEAMATRHGPFAERERLQSEILGLPLLPTTTIGSFPQTDDVRRARADRARGKIDETAYRAFLDAETEKAIRWQEEVGLDVLVHGEFERNDMVQYFGERLSGFAFTRHGWVQSYGSRCVRPPILYGDVSRPAPITVDTWERTQALTTKPVKGMLTGPVTILNWSFVRDDLARSAVCRQIALAIRDEVVDLETAGARLIQIDEAALREGLPLRKGDWAAHLDWAVGCFRLASTGVADRTQIHTHMCYSEFNDIIEAIAAMDADVISIECSRSKMELLDVFRRFHYPNQIGPGVWDIHSPRVPEAAEIEALLRVAISRLPADRLWVNPDCGLKTRGWPETRAAIAEMVAVTRKLRSEISKEVAE